MRRHPNDPAYMKRRPNMNETFTIPAWTYLLDTDPKESSAVRQELSQARDEIRYLHPAKAIRTFEYGHTVVQLAPFYDFLSPIEKAVLAGDTSYGATIKGNTVRLGTSD